MGRRNAEQCTVGTRDEFPILEACFKTWVGEVVLARLAAQVGRGEDRHDKKHYWEALRQNGLIVLVAIR